MYKGKFISVVVPAYDEQELIEVTLTTLPEFVDHIIAVNDGSSDKTKEIILDLQKKDNRITLIHFEENQGVGLAIVSGYNESIQKKVDIAVVMAGDNQMDPHYLPDLIEPIVSDNTDYSKGNRLYDKEHSAGMPTFRYIGNHILTLLTKIASGYWHIIDPQNGYTAISRKALLKIPLDKVYHYYGYCNDILIKLNVYGLRVMDIPIPAKYGKEKSGIQYGPYIFKVSFLLLRGFFYRMYSKIHPSLNNERL